MLPDWQPWVIAGGLGTIACFAGALESALLSLSRSRLEELLAENGGDAAPAEEGEQPPAPAISGFSRYMRKVTAGEPMVQLAATLLAMLTFAVFIIYGWMVWIAPCLREGSTGMAILAMIILMLAAAVIRTASLQIGREDEERLIVDTARFAGLLTMPLLPVAWLMLQGATVVARGLGRRTEMSEEEKLEEREGEVIAAVSDGALDGIVAGEQAEMIENVFELKDTDVADIFTPRTEMVSIPVETSLADAIAQALERGFSRLPVHQETRDNVIGIFYVRDALQYWQDTAKAPALCDVMRKCIFIPETKKVPELLREMREGQTHMAIVLDEYGGTAGLVTIEDVLEEIVGEITDEYDTEDSEEPLRNVDDDTVVAEGYVHVSDVNNALDVETIPEDNDYETVGGFVLDNLGHIPTAGESFEYEDLAIRVVAADERKVRRVMVRRLRNGRDTG